MISLSGIAVLFGNKRNAEGECVLADGLLERVPHRCGTRLRLHSYRLYRRRIRRDSPKNQGGDERHPITAIPSP
ncbi:hypothetical protein M8494_02610 [Serratia ureilytica]